MCGRATPIGANRVYIVTMEIRTKVLPSGNIILSEYEADDSVYCPACGEKKVWVERGGADFYEGFGHVCVGCGTYFTMPSFKKINDGDPILLNVLKTIREATHGQA